MDRRSPEAGSIILAYSWPGNVRELENVMQRVAILCEEPIEPDGLPINSTGPGAARAVQRYRAAGD